MPPGRERRYTRTGIGGRFAVINEFGAYSLYRAKRGDKAGQLVGAAIDFAQATAWLSGSAKPRSIEMHHVSQWPAPRGLWKK